MKQSNVVNVVAVVLALSGAVLAFQFTQQRAYEQTSVDEMRALDALEQPQHEREDKAQAARVQLSEEKDHLDNSVANLKRVTTELAKTAAAIQSNVDVNVDAGPVDVTP